MTRLLSRIPTLLICLGTSFLALGCGSPSRANIELRKENQQLHSELTQLQRIHQADQQVIQALRDRAGYLPTLPASRLAKLFTTHAIRFGRLTGGAKLDPKKPDDEGLAMYVVITDDVGDKIKAAGSFDIEAFDLAEPQSPLVGHWHFDVDQARKYWTDVLLEYNYALICPWQNKVPVHPDLTVKVTFFDELTQTSFTTQGVVHVNISPSATTQKG